MEVGSLRMKELIVTNANLPLAIRWWAKTYGRVCTYHQRNGHFLITLDMDRDRTHHPTVISISALPENLAVELDISDLAWVEQEALKDCFSQEVIDRRIPSLQSERSAIRTPPYVRP
jgi:hypothetical protein